MGLYFIFAVTHFGLACDDGNSFFPLKSKKDSVLERAKNAFNLKTKIIRFRCVQIFL